MYINHKEKILVYTSFFLIIPLIISIKNQYVGESVLIGLVTIFSTAFHTFKKPGAEWWWETMGRSSTQTLLLIIELTLSIILAAWSLVSLSRGYPSWNFAVAIAIFIPSFILYLSTSYKKYVFYHSIWHLAVSIIISLALI